MYVGPCTGSGQPPSSAHPGFHPCAPLPRAPGQLDPMPPSQPLRKEGHLSGWLPGRKAGLADKAPPGTSPTPQFDRPLLLSSGSQNQKSHEGGSFVSSRGGGGIVVEKATLACRIITLLHSFIGPTLGGVLSSVFKPQDPVSHPSKPTLE